MSRYFITTVLVALLIGLTGQSCAFPLHIGPPSDGGVFKSVDRGQSWQQSVSLASKAKSKSTFGNVDVSKLLIDPRDGNTVYAATKRFGLFQTTSGGEDWVRIYPQDVYVVDVAPDPRSRCVIYVVLTAQIIKTSDCAAHWSVIFNETRKGVQFTSLAIYPKDPSAVYAANSAGELDKSDDYGATWTSIFTMSDTGLEQVVIDRTDHDTLFLGTTDKGVFRSLDQGVQWEDISVPIKTSENSTAFRFMGPLSHHNAVWFVSKNSIFRTQNGGTTWDRLSLLTPPIKTTILAAAFNPANDDEVYYATASTLYRSADAGQTWTARPLPTSRAASYLVVDPFNGDRLFMGAQVFKNTPFVLF